MSNLILIRGLPGAGKSYLANKWYPEYLHYDVDHLFEDVNGQYRFDAQLMKKALDFVFCMADFAVTRKENVVVSHTFLTVTEIYRFLRLADRKDVVWTVIDVARQGNHFSQSTHNIPASVYIHMQNKWESFDPANATVTFDTIDELDIAVAQPNLKE